MINNVYVEMLAFKIFTKSINPNTGQEFKYEDIKKTEYIPLVKARVEILIKEKEEQENGENKA